MLRELKTNEMENVSGGGGRVTDLGCGTIASPDDVTRVNLRDVPGPTPIPTFADTDGDGVDEQFDGAGIDQDGNFVLIAP